MLQPALTVRLGGREALREVDLALEPGRFTVVVGPNGAGKTTLLRCLAGLIQPDRGTVTLNGDNLRQMTGSSRAKAIAYLAQNGTVAWPIPVASVVALGRLPHGEKPDALTPAGREAVAAAIASVGLRGFESRAATELSGGERARVLLARALATRAPVLLVDEPVAALDPRHELVVLERAEGPCGGGRCRRRHHAQPDARCPLRRRNRAPGRRAASWPMRPPPRF